MMQVLQMMMGGGGGGGGGKWGGGKGGKRQGNNGMIVRKAKSDPGQVVWLGGLEDAIGKDGNKELKEHIASVAGVEVKFVNITKKGEGGAIFGSDADAAAAIASANGTTFKGKVLQVDKWVKKDA